MALLCVQNYPLWQSLESGPKEEGANPKPAQNGQFELDIISGLQPYNLGIST